MTKVNFRSLNNWVSVTEVYNKLVKYEIDYNASNAWRLRGPHQGHNLDHYYELNLQGHHLIWANDNFPAEDYLWYYWFDPVFIVPPKMYLHYVMIWS
jgi:hypothetical protein